MMTEEQASKCWCPMVRLRGRYDGDNYQSFNRFDKFENELVPECHCIASRCAMWRWGSLPSGQDWVGGEAKGFCGLAGRPS